MEKEIKKMVDDALIGEVNPLQVYSRLKILEDIIKKSKEDLLESAITEFEKYGEKEVQDFGFKISSSAGGRYDYSNNQDYTNLKNRMKEIEKQMQLAYKANGTVIDEDTGEVFEAAIYKPNKISLTFKYLK